MKPGLKFGGRHPKTLPGLVAVLLVGLLASLGWVATVQAAASLTAINSPQLTGGAIVFEGSGYAVSESLSMWTTAPDGTVRSLTDTTSITTDIDGSVKYALITYGFASGRWSLTIHGRKSNAEASASFELLPEGAAVPTPTLIPGVPTPTTLPVDLPPDVTATPNSGAGPVPQGGLVVTPNIGYPGQTFHITGDGFTPEEPLSLWETTPDKYAIKRDPVFADKAGKFDYYYGGRAGQVGIWSLTAHGLKSGVEKTGYLRLLNGSAQDLATLELTPDHGDVSTKITVKGTNLLPTETYSYYATAPDGRVYAGAQDKVANDGTLTFVYQIPDAKPGRWSITINGITSRRQAIAYFNYE